MSGTWDQYHQLHVAPHGGAWIEILIIAFRWFSILSPLTEGRGLKSASFTRGFLCPLVAPHGGAWIEMFHPHPCRSSACVAPHGGAWIEIRVVRALLQLESRVAPHGGAWIEI